MVKSERTAGRYQVVFSNGASVFIDGPPRFTDTLECGHVVVRHTRGRSRRCEQCQ